MHHTCVNLYQMLLISTRHGRFGSKLSPRIVLTQFCESGSGESVTYRPPRSGTGNSELRIRIQLWTGSGCGSLLFIKIQRNKNFQYCIIHNCYLSDNIFFSMATIVQVKPDPSGSVINRPPESVSGSVIQDYESAEPYRSKQMA